MCSLEVDVGVADRQKDGDAPEEDVLGERKDRWKATDDELCDKMIARHSIFLFVCV